MSDQSRSDHSHAIHQASASANRKAGGARFAGFTKRLPYYALAVIVAVLVLAWIDGGEEPLHPITQSVELGSPAEGA